MRELPQPRGEELQGTTSDGVVVTAATAAK